MICGRRLLIPSTGVEKSEGGRERQQRLSLVERFEGGLELGGLGLEFRRSHNLEGG